MQLIATSFAATQQASAVLSTKAILSQQAAESVESYLRRGAFLPASSYQPLPVATGFFGKLLTLVR